MINQAVVPVKKEMIQGCRKSGKYSLSCGVGQYRVVNLYDVDSLDGLNQLIGYVVFRYKDCKVLYRGLPRLHSNVLPSLYRNIFDVQHQQSRWKIVQGLIEEIRNDAKLRKTLNLRRYDNSEHRIRKMTETIIIESVLQHYGIPTRNLDAVDNHWIALWFGLHLYREEYKKSGVYAHYVRRGMGDYRYLPADFSDDGFQYILVMAVKTQFLFAEATEAQVIDAEAQRPLVPQIDTQQKYVNYAVDLRRILPSTFLRPAAQHGWMIAPAHATFDQKNDYANHVVCILRMKVENVNQWMGEGGLITQGNLFPSPLLDQGYDVLLDRPDLFQDLPRQFHPRIMV